MGDELDRLAATVDVNGVLPAAVVVKPNELRGGPPKPGGIPVKFRKGLVEGGNPG